MNKKEDMFGFLKTVLVVISSMVPVSEECRSEVKKKQIAMYLPPPEPRYLEIADCSIAILHWDPVVVTPDSQNPILGFKIKLWEDEKKEVYKYIEKDGEHFLIQDFVVIKKSLQAVPTHKPALEAMLPPDVLEARFRVNLGVQYEVRGQSFNTLGDGPLSSAIGVKINAPEINEMIK